MPTGSGKSLCYQLPAMLLEGTTIVISPLIALMKDPLDGLRKRGVPAAAVHSGLPAAMRSSAQVELAAGRLRMIYIAPERLSNRAFREVLARTRVSRLVIDEAHCISQWGHDFRPDYLRLGGSRSELGVPVAAFTAAATPEVRADIVRQLTLKDTIEVGAGSDAARGMAAMTAARLLRRAAEAHSIRLGEGEPPIDMAVRAEKARRDQERLQTMVRYANGRG
jgi:ATP-dependent DNA helicase RecQ